ncbi:sce7725 family protein [Janthinobacterium rivuli]|uniref:Sce7725 family protein n=1 Tax=Janthinobacterium rivuli TaxID=2751478 RepID=A0ABY8I7H5_9BURK|nr:sce7725 family protein [Janthinobacterium rivuli]WFR80882.1 sce7725 family protein [Janthinobacterium rivuli]
MYYPYFRGKQFDLITIRECAPLMAKVGFTPIVEPVKENLNGLKRAIDAVNSAGGDLILIVNPVNGEHSEDPAALTALMQDELNEHQNIAPGILLSEGMTVEAIMALCNSYRERQITLIHSGFTDRTLADHLEREGMAIRHVFVGDNRLYRKHFKGDERILVLNGFEKRANRQHPEYEEFSDLHVTFEELGMDGFGDFLIVGADYSDGGGPAYSVAIHLTCIDPSKDDAMFIHHFKSIRYETPTDPAGKFAEALDNLAAEVNSEGTNILKTNAVLEFLSLRDSGHFPGLGYAKKLSMNHHIETLAAYFLAKK